MYNLIADINCLRFKSKVKFINMFIEINVNKVSRIPSEVG